MDKKDKFDRRESYQKTINEVVQKLNGKKFCKVHFAEAIGVSRERARQIINRFDLQIPNENYLESPEFADLKKLVMSGEISSFTPEELYENRYKKALPKDLIRGYVSYKGKCFISSRSGFFKTFFDNINTEDFTLEELYEEFKKMFPNKAEKMNFWAFSVSCYERGIAYKKIRKPKSNTSKDEIAFRQSVIEFKDFVEKNNIDCSLYSVSQMALVYEKLGGVKFTIPKMRKVILKAGLDHVSVKSIALNNRLLSLGIDLKASTNDEIVKAHNDKFPLVPIVRRDLNSYYVYFLLNE
mgnify:CR=1 FL=1